MDPHKKNKKTDCLFKTDLTLWIDADVQCMNVPKHYRNQINLIVGKPKGVRYNIVKNLYHDGNLLLRKNG